MRRDAHLLYLLEDLRIPLEDPTSPTDWKEWYHFVMFEPSEDVRVLANVSLSGRPGYGQISVTALASLPQPDGRHQTHGFCRDVDWEPGMVSRAPVRMTATSFECLIDGPRSRFHADNRAARLDLRLEGEVTSQPVLIPEYAPFGSGFIGWGLAPGLDLRGSISVAGRSIPLTEKWFCYHDHNYGRFRWGDDIGWIWFVVSTRNAAGEEQTLVLHRGNNRDASRAGAPYLFVYEQRAIRKVFMGNAVDIAWTWTDDPIRPTRLPGSMASLFADRFLRVPNRLQIRAADERDGLSLDMRVDSLLELVLPDNEQRQYTFIKEMSGKATAHVTINGRSIESEGTFYAEFVH